MTAPWELSTRRRYMEVSIDGEVRELPLSLTVDELCAQFEALEISAHKTDAGVVIDGEVGAKSMAGSMRWFRDFCAKYLGDAAKDAPADALQGLRAEWDRRRKDELGVDPGEA